MHYKSDIKTVYKFSYIDIRLFDIFNLFKTDMKKDLAVNLFLLMVVLFIMNFLFIVQD